MVNVQKIYSIAFRKNYLRTRNSRNQFTVHNYRRLSWYIRKLNNYTQRACRFYKKIYMLLLCLFVQSGIIILIIEFYGGEKVDNIVEVVHLWKSFKIGTEEIQVLKDINLSIKKGEFISIMGPSGSGKSTLLYLIGGLDSPTSGYISIMGNKLSSMNDRKESLLRRRHIGFVFQFYNLIPNLNVEDNIMLPILLDGKKISDYKDRMNELIEAVGLSERKCHTPRELSGGQQQRVAIARALINDPELILADEPTGNLDTKAGNEIMELLKKISEERKKTILLVTHSREAAEYSSKIFSMKDGQFFRK